MKPSDTNPGEESGGGHSTASTLSGPHNDGDVGNELRHALRGLAGSLVLIAAADGNGRRAVMSATSANALTMAPPAMLFCINRGVSTYPVIEEAERFSINILGRDHLELAQLCGGRRQGEDRFALGSWLCDDHGVPYLCGAQSSLICIKERAIHFGTHDVVFGLVQTVMRRNDIDPLLYLDGGYRAIGMLLNP